MGITTRSATTFGDGKGDEGHEGGYEEGHEGHGDEEEGDGRDEGADGEEGEAGEAREALRGAEGQEGPFDEQGSDWRARRAHDRSEEGLLHEGPQGARGGRAQAPGEGDSDHPEHRPPEDAHEEGDEGRRQN